MPKKTDLKLIGLIAIGVMAAGFTMNMFRDVKIVNDIKSGFR